MVDVAQLVRALVCGTRGCGFESHLPPHTCFDIFVENFSNNSFYCFKSYNVFPRVNFYMNFWNIVDSSMNCCVWNSYNTNRIC